MTEPEIQFTIADQEVVAHDQDKLTHLQSLLEQAKVESDLTAEDQALLAQTILDATISDGLDDADETSVLQ